MTDVAIPLNENLSRGSESVEFNGDAYSMTVRRSMPFFVARDQLYYWTREWQDGEDDALREITAGEARRFATGAAAAAWLLSDDED